MRRKGSRKRDGEANMMDAETLLRSEDRWKRKRREEEEGGVRKT